MARHWRYALNTVVNIGIAVIILIAVNVTVEQKPIFTSVFTFRSDSLPTANSHFGYLCSK